MKLPEKKEIALDLYHRLSTDTENTDLFDKVVDLSYENEQLRSKIQVSQDKLEKAYEFLIIFRLRILIEQVLQVYFVFLHSELPLHFSFHIF